MLQLLKPKQKMHRHLKQQLLHLLQALKKLQNDHLMTVATTVAEVPVVAADVGALKGKHLQNL
jgi:hypothetical protein